MLDAAEILKGVEGISFVRFDERDVVRHSLVQRIVRAYEKYNEAIAGRQLSLKLAEPTSEPHGSGARARAAALHEIRSADHLPALAGPLTVPLSIRLRKYFGGAWPADGSSIALSPAIRNCAN